MNTPSLMRVALPGLRTDEVVRSPDSSTSPLGRRFLLSVVFSGVLGSLVGSVFMGQARHFFEMPKYPADLKEDISKLNPFVPPPAAIAAKVYAHQAKTLTLNTALVFILLAWTTMPIMGGVAGISIRSKKGVVRGLLVGLIAGLVMGALAGVSAVWLKSHLSWEPATNLICANALAWAIFAIGVAVTLVSVTLQWRKLGVAILSAVLAGLISVVAYQPLAMLISPLEILDTILPNGMYTRALYASLPVSLIGLTIARALTEAPKKQPASDV